MERWVEKRLKKKRKKGGVTITLPRPHRGHLRPTDQVLCFPVLGRLPPLQRLCHPVRGRAHALPLQHAQGKVPTSLKSTLGWWWGTHDTVGRTLRRFLPFVTPQRADDREHGVRLALGNGLRAEVWKEFLQRFGPISIWEFYGATEGNAGFINYTGKIGAVGRANVFLKVSRWR